MGRGGPKGTKIAPKSLQQTPKSLEIATNHARWSQDCPDMAWDVARCFSEAVLGFRLGLSWPSLSLPSYCLDCALVWSSFCLPCSFPLHLLCLAFPIPVVRIPLTTTPGLGNIAKRTNQPATKQLATSRFQQPSSQTPTAATRTASSTQQSLTGRNTFRLKASAASAGVAKRLQLYRKGFEKRL